MHLRWCLLKMRCDEIPETDSVILSGVWFLKTMHRCFWFPPFIILLCLSSRILLSIKTVSVCEFNVHCLSSRKLTVSCISCFFLTFSSFTIFHLFYSTFVCVLYLHELAKRLHYTNVLVSFKESTVDNGRELYIYIYIYIFMNT